MAPQQVGVNLGSRSDTRPCHALRVDWGGWYSLCLLGETQSRTPEEQRASSDCILGPGIGLDARWCRSGTLVMATDSVSYAGPFLSTSATDLLSPAPALHAWLPDKQGASRPATGLVLREMNGQDLENGFLDTLADLAE